VEQLTISAAQQAEIQRKAQLGIPLTNPTAEAQVLYQKARAAATQPQQAIAQTTTTKSQVAAAASSTAGAAATARAKREAERAAFTGWDNDPEVRSLQERWWAIYIDTGKKDTAEQKQLNEQAQKTRAYNNPTYNAGASPSGPKDWIDAEHITPRDTTPNTDKAETGLDAVMNVDNFGSYLKVGGVAIGAMMILSMFKGRR
jgi:hypothetical protein